METRLALKQVAALPYRVHFSQGLQILLTTSIQNRNWILPKGHIDSGLTPADAAAQEALEEAGVIGIVAEASSGIYNYTKIYADGRQADAEVAVYPLSVTQELESWPDAERRDRRWWSREEAAQLVKNEGLSAILVRFSV